MFFETYEKRVENDGILFIIMYVHYTVQCTYSTTKKRWTFLTEESKIGNRSFLLDKWTIVIEKETTVQYYVRKKCIQEERTTFFRVTFLYKIILYITVGF